MLEQLKQRLFSQAQSAQPLHTNPKTVPLPLKKKPLGIKDFKKCWNLSENPKTEKEWLAYAKLSNSFIMAPLPKASYDYKSSTVNIRHPQFDDDGYRVLNFRLSQQSFEALTKVWPEFRDSVFAEGTSERQKELIRNVINTIYLPTETGWSKSFAYSQTPKTSPKTTETSVQIKQAGKALGKFSRYQREGFQRGMYVEPDHPADNNRSFETSPYGWDDHRMFWSA